MKKRIPEKCYLKRTKSKRVGRIQREHPDIGETIEEYVRKCGVGADAWRRTGVLTFHGNHCVGKKVTFKRTQEHLKAKYTCAFSYGTVVQLYSCALQEINGESLPLDTKVWCKLIKGVREKVLVMVLT